MKVSLTVVTEGKAPGKAIPITLSQFLIGRDPQCQLRPASAVISKRHCAILVKNGKVLVRDFDSTNGTFVNDAPVKGQREVHHDDQLRVGPLTFRITIEGMPPINKPTPPPPKPAEAGSEDDSVAAMLLALQDDAAGPSSGLKDADGVPQGSTVMDIPPVPAGSSSDAETPNETALAKSEPKKEPVKQDAGNTSSAAKAILEKYTRRPRG